MFRHEGVEVLRQGGRSSLNFVIAATPAAGPARRRASSWSSPLRFPSRLQVVANQAFNNPRRWDALFDSRNPKGLIEFSIEIKTGPYHRTHRSGFSGWHSSTIA
jgi:hypothetical protein